MRNKILLHFMVFSANILAQDIDFYNKNKNDNFLLPQVAKEMSFSEFQIMSRTFRMQDMMYSMIVPGYVHFKAKDKTMGYSLLTVRSLAYATLGYEAFWSQKTAADTSIWLNLQNFNSLSSQSKTNTLLLASAMFAIGSTYLFDIIHGKYRLEKKQEAIRYKYSLKASLSVSYRETTNDYFLGFRVFYYF